MNNSLFKNIITAIAGCIFISSMAIDLNVADLNVWIPVMIISAITIAIVL